MDYWEGCGDEYWGDLGMGDVGCGEDTEVDETAG